MNAPLKPQFEMLRDSLSVANEKSAIDMALRKFANVLGFEWFAYLSVEDANVYGLSNYPVDWQEHYLANALAKVDPVVEAICPKRGPYYWSDRKIPIAFRREHRRFFGEARSFGIRSGISIPVFDGFGRRALFTFASGEQMPDTSMLVDPYTALTLGAFIDANLQRRDCDDLMRAAPSPLTSYQLECLCWLKAGKTTDDIAAIRNVSRRAVEFQLQNIRQKLDVLTTYQALCVAVKRRWI